MAIMPEEYLTHEMINDEKIIQKCDEKSLKSINGLRNSDKILNSVSNNEFTYLLKFIKLWARNKGIYSGKIGYLGGISWAILCAKICQMYPKLALNRLI
jgi:poly(A) polymerase